MTQTQFVVATVAAFVAILFILILGYQRAEIRDLRQRAENLNHYSNLLIDEAVRRGYAQLSKRANGEIDFSWK